MGSFSAKVRVWNPSSPEKVEEVEAMVDTGAAFSWIHRERLERLGAETLRRIGFRAIDGSIIERETAAVWVASDGFRAPDIVVMAEASDMEVIGVHTIEGLGLAADPVQKKLIPTVMPALGASDVTRNPYKHLLAKAIGVKDFFGSVLLRDGVTDWNLAKEVGEFLIRIEPDSKVGVVGRILLVRAYRHLGRRAEALDELKQCWQVGPHRRLTPIELELFVPLLSQEEKLLLGRDAAN